MGLRVMDIATVYAAPFAAALCSRIIGADVLKVEMPGVGDPLRGLEPFDGEESLVWAALSRNKRSVTLDLRKEQGPGDIASGCSRIRTCSSRTSVPEH